MCQSPECTALPAIYKVTTQTVPDKLVEVHVCPVCDVRTCNFQGVCKETVPNPMVKKCPKGHTL